MFVVYFAGEGLIAGLSSLSALYLAHLLRFFFSDTVLLYLSCSSVFVAINVPGLRRPFAYVTVYPPYLHTVLAVVCY